MDIKRPKICVPIVDVSRDAIIENARNIAKLDVEIVEWRVDFFAGYEEEMVSVAKELKGVLGDKELIVTLRTTHEGGEPNGDRINYFKLVTDICEAGDADYVDIEYKIFTNPQNKEFKEKVEDIKKKSKTKMILSYHDFNKVDDEEAILEILEGEHSEGADICKYAAMPSGDDVSQHEDVFRLLCVTEKMSEKYPEESFVTMTMGDAGKLSRIYGGLYGSRISFGALGKASAPGQIDVGELGKLFDLVYKERENKHIALIGFMGAGKTTVSDELSRSMGCPEYDTDSMIVDKEGTAISNIFADKGEMYFRDVETFLLNDLARMPQGIISCGGGMAIRDINIKMLRQIADVVLLSAKPETIYERVKDSTDRPLLNGNMNVEYIEGLMKKRLPFYEKCATRVVSTDGKSVEEIVANIREK